MAQIPPPTDVIGPDSRKQWINAYQSGLWAACQNIDNTTIFMHRAMADALRSEGVDQAGRFGGSSADKAASSVSSKLKRASEHIEAAIKLMKAADAAAAQNVDVPIKAARDARARAKPAYTV
jgi:hypothetical protein